MLNGAHLWLNGRWVRAIVASSLLYKLAGVTGTVSGRLAVEFAFFESFLTDVVHHLHSFALSECG